jgi:glycosyltransferase involved in cell wall biosynthesis
VKKRLVVIGPVPPQYHGVTVSTTLVLANRLLQAVFDVHHVDTSDDRSGKNIGRWDLRNMLLATRALIRLARSLRDPSDVVYLPLSQNVAGFVRDSLLVHIAALRGCRIAVHLRGGEFRAFYEGSPRLLRNWIRRTLSRVTSVAVMGDSLRWVFEGLVPSDRIAVVPNGTPEPVADGAVRDVATVLFLSNLRRRKGVVEAVEAARLVVREHAAARFLFVGEWEDESLERELRALAADAGGRIRFQPPVAGPEKDRLLASASVMLFPPIEAEGHPRVVIEALAVGMPVIATDRGAIRDTIVDGSCGFLLEEAVPSELAAQVVRLLENDDLRCRMGRAARARYLDAFTQERTDRTFVDWILNVATN